MRWSVNAMTLGLSWAGASVPAEATSSTRKESSAPFAAPVPDPMAEIELAAREAEIARLKDKLAALEQRSEGQVRALQALVELLVESGLIARDEYLQKAKRPE